MKVQIVRRKGNTTLVKYLDSGDVLRMVIVPSNSIIDETVDNDVLEMAIVYGLPWEEIATIKAIPQMIADKLRQYNIWTLEDAQANPQTVTAALMSVYGIDAAALLKRARQYVKAGGK